MSNLSERIQKDGIVVDESILKIDSFLNHQIDPTVISEIVNDFYDYFKDKRITKVFTIEASGIAPAIMTAAKFQVPMLFAKKTTPSTLKNNDFYSTDVHSYTKNQTSKVIVSTEYLSKDDRVLIIDDFLANGQAAFGLINLVNQAGAEVSGVGICVEKSFQKGRGLLDAEDVDVYSVCRISSLKDNQVHFIDGH